MIRLFGVRLHAQDGSVGEWCFFDQSSCEFFITVQLKNNSSYDLFCKNINHLRSWAHSRELTVESCQFNFNPEKMEFTRIEE